MAAALTGCTEYPGQDPPCTGTNAHQPGCASPVEQIKDSQPNQEWYIQWGLNFVRLVLSQAGVNAVKLGVSIFWLIFTNLHSTDFLACSSGGSGPTCQTVTIFSEVRLVAFELLVVVVFWKFFKSYFLGQVFEGWFESAAKFIPRFILTAFALGGLLTILTYSFGLSNLIFTTILGGPQELEQLATRIVGNGKDIAGVTSVSSLLDPGLMFIMFVVNLAVGIVFLLLGVVFFLQTILVYILVAMSPLAVVAAYTEEFRVWWQRWLNTLQTLLIAPLPVAITLKLVNSFGSNIPSAHEDPGGYTLQLIYVVAFLFIGSLLMFRIGGAISGGAFGILAGGAGMGIGRLLGGGRARGGRRAKNKGRGGKAGSGAGTGEEIGSEGGEGGGEEDGGEDLAGGSTMVDSWRGGGGGNRGGGSGRATGYETGGSASSGGVFGSSGSSSYRQQQQFQAALAGLQESLNASGIAKMQLNSSAALYGGGGNGEGEMPLGYGWTGTGTGGGAESGRAFNYGAAYNAQNFLLWAGRQAGVEAPLIIMRPGPKRGKRRKGLPRPPAPRARARLKPDDKPRPTADETSSIEEGEEFTPVDFAGTDSASGAEAGETETNSPAGGGVIITTPPAPSYSLRKTELLSAPDETSKAELLALNSPANALPAGATSSKQTLAGEGEDETKDYPALPPASTTTNSDTGAGVSRNRERKTIPTRTEDHSLRGAIPDPYGTQNPILQLPAPAPNASQGYSNSPGNRPPQEQEKGPGEPGNENN